MAQKPNPNDPSLVDVYDDNTGAYLTTIPKESAALQQLVQGPPATQPGPQFNMEQDANRILSVGAADGGPPAENFDPATGGYRARPVPSAPTQGDDKLKIAGALGQTDPTGAPLTPAPAADVDTLVSSMRGSADRQQEQPTLGAETAGGFQPTERQTSGLPESALRARRGDIEAIAGLEGAAALDEATAMEQQLVEDQKRQAEMERTVKEDRAKQAIEQKQVFDRRQRVEQKIAAVSAQEPDRHRAFPKGWRLVGSFIGAIAGGMLSGLSDGRYQNQTLESLNRVLESDVQQQRETQSTMLKELTRQLGSLDAAEDMLRAKQKEIVLREFDARMLGSQNKVAPAKLEAFRSRMQADIARHRVDALTKLERDETIKEVNTPGSAPVAFNAENYRAQSLKQIAANEGREIKDVHKDWNTWNKTFKERATLRAGLDTAERLIQQFERTNDVAGLGPLAKYIPSSINSKDAVAVRQVLGSLTAQYLKAISGAAVTEQEFARTIENLQGPGDADSVRRGLGLLRQGVQAQDEEDQTQNPGFFRLRNELKTLNGRERAGADGGRAEQEAAAGADIVTIPRSARIAFVHNNPGNLTFANQPGAERGEPKKNGGYWARFPSAGDGMRALARQVMKDQTRDLNVRQFVEKYAPDTENDVESYLTKLNRLLGVDEATPLSEVSAGAMAYAIAQIESGTRPNAQRR